MLHCVLLLLTICQRSDKPAASYANIGLLLSAYCPLYHPVRLVGIVVLICFLMVCFDRRRHRQANIRAVRVSRTMHSLGISQYCSLADHSNCIHCISLQMLARGCQYYLMQHDKCCLHILC